MTATECVILVDEQDNEIGVAEKLAAHQQNLLHRAFSIFIFRKTNGVDSQQNSDAKNIELLLQQRALHKYHSPGLWTNTCCSHPRPGESIIAAGNRRLYEEMGLSAPLTSLGWFKYNAYFPNGLSEHEIDHVLVGQIVNEVSINPNPEEVHDIRWITLTELAKELANHPEQFTPWLESALKIASNSCV